MMKRTSDGQCIAPATKKMSPGDFGVTGDTRLYWLGQAGFVLNTRGVVLLLDPLLITMPGPTSETGMELLNPWPIDVTEVPRVDAVLYTHTDNNHLGPETAKALMKLDPIFIGTMYTKEKLTKLGAFPVRCLSGVPQAGTPWRGKNGNSFDIGSAKIELLPADHPWQLADPEKYGRVFGPEDCCGYKITTQDGIFVFPGDTRLMKHHLELRNITVLTLDVCTDPYHMGPQGTAVLANHMEDVLLVPCHYGTFKSDSSVHNGDPEAILGGIRGGYNRGRILAPGEPLTLVNGKEIKPRGATINPALFPEFQA
ncbi:MAG: MBL fold metallo-hydrolase [Treponema sp.]|jgi:L-ascorbate metabolism protein UlaG (beta-lactamase superfamily)|nr:MBL fold metallo-hydrolase [Treponema sp.]